MSLLPWGIGVRRAGQFDCLREGFDLLMMRVEDGSNGRGEDERRESKMWWPRVVREASRGRVMLVPRLQRVPALGIQFYTSPPRKPSTALSKFSAPERPIIAEIHGPCVHPQPRDIPQSRLPLFTFSSSSSLLRVEHLSCRTRV